MTIKYYQSKVSWQTFEQKLCEDFFDSAIFWDLSWPLALASSSCVLAVSGKFLAEYAKRDSIIPLTGLPEVAWWKWLKIMWTGEVRNGEQRSFMSKEYRFTFNLWLDHHRSKNICLCRRTNHVLWDSFLNSVARKCEHLWTIQTCEIYTSRSPLGTGHVRAEF